MPSLNAQWTSGSLYKEYYFLAPNDGEAFLSEDGLRFDDQARSYSLPDSLLDGNWLLLPGKVDLELARRAEVVIERVQSIEGSKGLRIRWNQGRERFFGLPTTVPAPADEYHFHLHHTMEIPIWELRRGQNRFQLQLDSIQGQPWPRNQISGLLLRVYYAPEKSTKKPPQIDYATRNVPATSLVRIAPDSQFTTVDYALEASEMDWSGDGIYRRIHWQTHRGEPFNTLGSSKIGPDFTVAWDTNWLPDQRLPMRIHVRARDEMGLYHVGQPSMDLTLSDRPYRIALITPTQVPRNWVTHSGTFAEKLQLSLEPERVKSFQLLWNAWSPCYANGLFLNQHLLWMREGDCYAFAPLMPIFSGRNLSFLQKGENDLRTALTPRFNGQMVHGMEVQWPGIVMKVKYK